MSELGTQHPRSSAFICGSLTQLKHQRCSELPAEILAPIREKVEAGERLTFDDGLLLESPEVPLPELGELANLVRERKNGNAGYYNINTHLNATNICVYRCSFCAFRSDLREAKGYWMQDDDDPREAPRRSRTAAPRCTSSAACTTRRSTTGTAR